MKKLIPAIILSAATATVAFAQTEIREPVTGSRVSDAEVQRQQRILNERYGREVQQDAEAQARTARTRARQAKAEEIQRQRIREGRTVGAEGNTSADNREAFRQSRGNPVMRNDNLETTSRGAVVSK